MNQTRIESLIEAMIHTAVGFVFSVLLSPIVYPLFGHRFTMAQNIGITAVFTLISIGRGYYVRRFFNQNIHRAAIELARAFFK